MTIRKLDTSRHHRLEKEQPRAVAKSGQKAAATPADGFAPSKTAPSHAAESLLPSQVPHSWSEQLQETSTQTGAHLKRAGELLHDGGDGLGVADPMAIEAHSLGNQATTLGSRVESLAKASHVPARDIRVQASDLEQRADGLYGRVVQAAESGRDIAAHVIEKIGDGAKAIGRAVKTYTQGIGRAVDYEKNIDQLGDDDTYTLGLDALIVLGGPAVRGSGSIEVERSGGHYTVSVDGALGAGIFAEAGIQVLGVGLDTHGSVTAGRGIRHELTVETADAAKAAVRLVLSRLGKSATLRPLSTEEQEVFTKNLSAVELHRDVATEGLAILGLKGVIAALAEAGATTDHVVRVELGEEPALVLMHKLSAELYGAIGVASETDGGWAGHAGVGTTAGEAAVVLERRIALGSDFDAAAFQAQPGKALAALGTRSDLTRAAESVELTLEGKGGVLGSGGGFDVELSVGVGIEELKKSGAIGRMMRGDLQGALKQLPPSTEVSGRFEQFADYGVDIGPAIFFMGFGADIELEALRRDTDEPHAKTAHTDAAHGPAQLGDWFSSLRAQR